MNPTSHYTHTDRDECGYIGTSDFWALALKESVGGPGWIVNVLEVTGGVFHCCWLFLWWLLVLVLWEVLRGFVGHFGRARACTWCIV
jgi:hypothetical protein